MKCPAATPEASRSVAQPVVQQALPDVEGITALNLPELPTEIVDNYVVSERLGEGAYGVVARVTPADHGRRRARALPLALKRCFRCLDKADPVTLRRTYRELAVLRRICHIHIVTLRCAILPENCDDLYLAFDLADLDLLRGIRTGLVDESEPRHSVATQLLRALKYLHSARLLHRDLKPANVLLQQRTSSLVAQLADFGFVRQLGPYSRGLTAYAGMRWYRAPELLLGSQRYGTGVDIWAFGCIFGEMLLGRPLLSGFSAQDQLSLIVGLVLGRQVAKGNEADCICMLDLLPEGAEELLAAAKPEGERLEEKLHAVAGSEAIDLIRSCLQLAPEDRPEALQLLQHPLLAAEYDEMDELMWAEVVDLPLRDDEHHAPDRYLEEIAKEVQELQQEHHKSCSRCWCIACSAASAGLESGQINSSASSNSDCHSSGDSSSISSGIDHEDYV